MVDERIGIDVGGTFTDLVLLSGTRVVAKKVRSTPSDFSSAALEGLGDVLSGGGVAPDQLGEVIHGMTVVSNAVIEKGGARTGLITTKGFRDVLEIGRMTNPRRFDMSWDKPVPLVERYLRTEVRGRMTSSGEEFTPLDEEDVLHALEYLLDQGVSSIAVCYINSYANPAHEIATGELIGRRAPQVAVSLSSQVLPEVKEFERTSTTVINAYVKPVMERYLTGLERELRETGVKAPLLIMQSNGGIMSTSMASERPIYTAESGPAAGVIGVLKLGELIGERNLISFDMGGTTAKAAIVHEGAPDFCSEFEIGSESTGGWRLLKGSGYLMHIPAIDIAEVGSGGGSIAWIDAGDVPQVGPRSAGADPGPACYDSGGIEPTITDANLCLGYFNPQYLVGGELKLNYAKAGEAIDGRIAGPLDIPVHEAAYGIYDVANARMQQAVRAVTTERGRDPADYTLVAYGGCGPAHAAAMARQLGVKGVLVPPAPGVFSSFGLLFADIEHHYVRTYWRDLALIDLTDFNLRLGEMKEEALDILGRQGFQGDRVRLSFIAEMRYSGQGYELGVPLLGDRLDASALSDLADGFGREHERTFGYRSEEPVQLFRLRLVARGIPDGSRVPAEVQLATPASLRSGREERDAYFGPEVGWRSTAVLRERDSLRGGEVAGPLIVEEYDATTVVPPDATASVDRWGNIRIRL